MDDICTDVDKSREQGYQNIISNRGARAARQFQRNKAISEGKIESENGSRNETDILNESDEKDDNESKLMNDNITFSDAEKKEENVSRLEEKTENR